MDRKLKGLPDSHWFNIQQVAIRGTPDRLGVVNGNFIALELKTSKEESLIENETITLQRYELMKIREAGGYASFLYPENLESVMADLILMSTFMGC